MPMTMLSDSATFGDLQGSLVYCGPASSLRPRPAAAPVRSGLTPLTAAWESLASRLAEAA